MNIVLFNVSSTLTSDGSRLISSLLKKSGHNVICIFLSRSEPFLYTQSELRCVDPLLKDADLVMIAVYSNYAIRAIQLTEHIHRYHGNLKVYWGGPHCIAAPEIALRYADAVCYSEGDEAVVDFVNRISKGEDYFSTPNMAFKIEGKTKVNPVLPPYQDLDSLPYYDYDFTSHFMLLDDLFPMTKELFKEHCKGYPMRRPTFYSITSRGCPHNCSYCSNCRFVSMFGHHPIRFQSVSRFIDEIENSVRTLDFIEFIAFGDDDFFLHSKTQLAEFAELYRKKIDLPFGIALSANTYRSDKLEILLDSGLTFVQIGVESGSQRILDEVYNRKIKVRKTKTVIDKIVPFLETSNLKLYVDFIIDNPYETRNDIIKTFRYILWLPSSAHVNLFVLAFFPGTPIYDRALKDGFIQPYDESASRFYIKGKIEYQQNYETTLIFLVQFLKRKGLACKPFFQVVLRLLSTGTARIFGSLLTKNICSRLIKSLR